VDVRIVVRHGEIPAEVQQTIFQKASRLPRFFERSTAVEVICDLEHSTRARVEIRISAEERDDFFAADTGSNVMAAFDQTVDRIESQMRKAKERITGHHHRGREHNQQPD
jgi:ribosomal subunit interface protein